MPANDAAPLPDRIRPLEGAGLVNIASGMRAPLSGAPIKPMGCKREWRIAGPACGLLIAAALVYLVLAW